MKTILILEDDVIFSRSIGNWLKKKGMATEHATTLSAARKALSAREFDLVLADLRLPDGNSTSLLEWMNERFYATPFLIMTNYGQVENAVEAMQLGRPTTCASPSSRTSCWKLSERYSAVLGMTGVSSTAGRVPKSGKCTG